MRSPLILFTAATLTALLALPSAAWAKPSIAVLGLEVKSDSSSIDEETTMLANALTVALRKRARMPTGPYKLAPNSNKDLLELKLLSDCPDEGKGCMSQIGRELKADRLLYGRIKKRRTGYQVSLDLLNVGSKSMERSTSEIIPFKQTDPEGVKRWARSLYNRLTGIPDLGTLVIHANSDKGTVYIDGEVKTSLSAGSARITGLSEGSHTVGVESDGYESFGGEITITAGETETLDVAMSRTGGSGGGSGGKPGGASRVLFWTSVVAFGASGTAMAVTGLQVRGDLKDAQIKAIQDLADRQPNSIKLTSNNACSAAAALQTNPADAGLQAVIDACDKGKSRAMLTNVFMGATIASALAATYFYYKGYVVPKASSGQERAARRRSKKPKRRHVRVSPTLGPNQVGAGVTIEF